MFIFQKCASSWLVSYLIHYLGISNGLCNPQSLLCFIWNSQCFGFHGQIDEYCDYYNEHLPLPVFFLCLPSLSVLSERKDVSQSLEYKIMLLIIRKVSLNCIV